MQRTLLDVGKGRVALQSVVIDQNTVASDAEVQRERHFSSDISNRGRTCTGRPRTPGRLAVDQLLLSFILNLLLICKSVKGHLDLLGVIRVHVHFERVLAGA